MMQQPPIHPSHAPSDWADAMRQVTANLVARIHKLEVSEAEVSEVSQTLASGDLTLTNVLQDMPGVSIVVDPGTYKIDGSFDFLTSNDDLDNNQTGHGALLVDGVAQTQEAIVTLSRMASGARLRSDVYKSWVITCANTCTVKLQARKTGGTGSSQLMGNNTAMIIVKVRTP